MAWRSFFPTTQRDTDVNTRYSGTVNAPDFPTGLDWLNIDHPLTMNDLRGKLILLDFWTFC